MKTPRLFTALTGLTIAGTLALSGCADYNIEEPDTAPQSSDEASAFLGCLTSAGVDAKINTSGQVLIKTPAQLEAGDEISSDDDEALAMERDDAGHLWIAAPDATYFSDNPETQGAYASCEEKHPDFMQPQSDPGSDPNFQQDQAQQEEAALEFAQCARQNGFSQVADPDASVGGAILLPDGFDESAFRALAEACYDPANPIAIASTGELEFDPWKILEEFQEEPAS
ncbi:MAG TPA: hypothetical protein GX718_03775 [Brevibacterium sp.]|nr:hypothetical protein [Brevibacterium sp.]